MFTLQKETDLGRRGTLSLSHGTIETPFFMPVGTAGAMKGITHQDLLDLGAQILLCNTYHLHLSPTEDIIEEAGGLHEFIHWKKPILTDSGGFQVFSLKNLRTIDDSGVSFRSHINGDMHHLSSTSSIEIQHKLGADMIMCFDECPPSTASREEIEKAVDRTLLWAKQCKETHEALKKQNGLSPMLFGIVQGGLEPDLRKKCAEELIAMDFDGYAIGGLAVGESEEEMFNVLDTVCPLLPREKPHYLMGVGKVDQMRTCIAKGIDMFDCVLPMRIARHGTLLISDGSEIKISNSKYRTDHTLLDPNSPSPLSKVHFKSYLHHLFKMNERFGETIAAMQNIGVTLKAMQELREEME